jgi:hypothetical protein
MLGRKEYTQEEFDRAKSAVKRLQTAYEKLVEALDGAREDQRVAAALAAFEPLLFNDMTLVLDRYFVHRLRSTTGKDSNPLNEVELLSNSLIENDGQLRGNSVIKYKPDDSVLKLEPGEPIRLSAPDFERLSNAFFAELQAKFVR